MHITQYLSNSAIFLTLILIALKINSLFTPGLQIVFAVTFSRHRFEGNYKICSINLYAFGPQKYKVNANSLYSWLYLLPFGSFILRSV